MTAEPHLFGVVRFGGPDARNFLQGQLSHDLRLLTPERPLLASHNTPQGRVVAVLQLFDVEGIVGLLPASMVVPLIERLRKYQLRAKVTMTDASNELPKLAAVSDLAKVTAATANEWRLQQIALGRPQIYPETSELFVAQMLNLDLIDGISFDKGCYTGQEIIARAHYRGQVKRRMLRYHGSAVSGLHPGDTVQIDQNHSGRIVEWASRPDGNIEFLAVVSPQSGDAEASIPNITQLPLPYAIPS